MLADLAEDNVNIGGGMYRHLMSPKLLFFSIS